MAMSCHNELNRISTTVGRTVESVHKNKREVLNLKDSYMACIYMNAVVYKWLLVSGNAQNTM